MFFLIKAEFKLKPFKAIKIYSKKNSSLTTSLTQADRNEHKKQIVDAHFFVWSKLNLKNRIDYNFFFF